MIQNEQPPLFKVWHKIHKKWIDPKEGNIALDIHGNIILAKVHNDFTEWFIEDKSDIEVCRFTSLFDKNNCPIYENQPFLYYGNLMYKMQGAKFIVAFRNGCFGYIVKSKEGETFLPFFMEFYDMQIVGGCIQNIEVLYE